MIIQSSTVSSNATSVLNVFRKRKEKQIDL